MPRSIKVNILLVGIPYVRPYGWGIRKYQGLDTIQGHEFDVRIELEFKTTWTFAPGANLDYDFTKLQWNEHIRWYAPDPYPPTVADPVWRMYHQDRVNFADAQHRAGVKTVQTGWHGSAFEPGWWKPWQVRKWRDVVEPLLPEDNPIVGFDAMTAEQQKFAVADYFRQNDRTIKTIMTDRPGLTKSPTLDDGTLANTGGGGLSTLNRKTRRRVIHFKVGPKPHFTTATQILETVNGTPTINKFVVPGLTIQESEEPARLARYRTEIDLVNINNFNTNP